jgi:glycosyltransferase involved in cell wall biosynthesis
MSYHANVAMALRLVEEIMPLVWACNPHVKVMIAGKDPPKRIQELGRDPRVTVTGTVRDLRPYLQHATIAAAPVEYGAGIQNKVLEAMACGTPVVATPQAVSAIDLTPGEDALIAADPQSFADSILRLLENKDDQRKLGENGRKYVEMNHRWSVIAGQLEGIYELEIGLKIKVA